MLTIFGKKGNSEDEPMGPGPFGPYHLQELINTGGMANLWQATNQEGQTVAVRLLLAKLKGDSIARKRFIAGCEILAQVHDHDYIIHYVEHGKLKGQHFLVMEYVEGLNLKEAMADEVMDLSDLIGNILIDSAEALEHVHDRGYMHLDFKPENILISRNGNVRLLDFDLSQARPETPVKLQKNPGTPAYMAPEQLRREPVDHRVDIFSFGVMCYEVLTGQKPFQGHSPDEILRKQMNRSIDFSKPRDNNPHIPIQLEKSILKALESDPNKRHGHISLLLHELRTTLYV
jgi:eukaryotic-like serine/threonine-protein kinase